MHAARRGGKNCLVFRPDDEQLSFNRLLPEAADIFQEPDGIIEVLIEQLSHHNDLSLYVDALEDAKTRNILPQIKFQRALEFFHFIKIVLHDHRLREDRLAEQTKRDFLYTCFCRLKELGGPTGLQDFTAGEWVLGNPLTQNWKFISQDWNKLAPIIMGTFIAIAARDDNNKDLRTLLEDKRPFYLIQPVMGNDRWSQDGSFHLRAVPTKLEPSRTTLAWEVAKNIWSTYNVENRARQAAVQAEAAQRKAEEASRLAQEAKDKAEQGYRKRRQDQRSWHAGF